MPLNDLGWCVACKYVLHIHSLSSFKTEAFELEKAIRALGRVSGSEVHWASPWSTLWCTHAVATPLLIQQCTCTTYQIEYSNMQVGYLKMQAGCEIKGICSLIPEYIALLSKRSHACAEDHQTVSLLSNFFQRQCWAYSCFLPKGHSINQSTNNTVCMNWGILKKTPLKSKWCRIRCEIPRSCCRLMLIIPLINKCSRALNCYSTLNTSRLVK